MADPPRTPASRGEAAASSFETAASTPSSRVETPSPVGINKKALRSSKINLMEGNKNTKKKLTSKEKTDSGQAGDLTDITMRDVMEAGPSRGKDTVTEVSDSDCELVETATGTAPSEVSMTSGMKRGKRRRMIVSDDSVSDSNVQDLIKEDTLDALTSLSAGTLATRAYECLSTVDNLRARSRNIQGSVSGNMKRNLMQVKRAITILLARVNATGDPKHLRKKIDDQAFEILSLQTKLKDAKHYEQYYKEQMGERAEYISSKRLDRTFRKAALKSRFINQKDNDGRRISGESSEELAMRAAIIPSESTDEPRQDRTNQRPEGMSPERWRRTIRRDRTAETRVESFADMNEIKLFIKQQIGEAVADMKRSRGNKQIDKEGNFKNKTRGLNQNSARTSIYRKTDRISTDDGNLERDDATDGIRDARNISWAEVASRSTRSTKALPARRDAMIGAAIPMNARSVKSVPRIKIPRLAAVSIHCRDKEDYPKVLNEAKSRINLKDIGITETTVSRSFSGSLMILIPREDEREKAPLLASKIAEMVADRPDIKISVPSKKAELKLTQIDCSTTGEHIREALMTYGGCFATDIRVGEIRYSQRGNGAAIVQCPAVMANDLVAEGRLKLGWSFVRVELVPAKTQRCYKCWESGHFLSNCKNEIDRSNNCFNCGEAGHKAKECAEKPCCPICKARSIPFDHQCGRDVCSMLAKPAAVRGRVGLGRVPDRRPDTQERSTLKYKNARRT